MTAVDFANFVDGLAAASGKAILPFFRTSLGVENKAEQGFDPVTAADRAAEVTIRTMIKQTFPTHGIIGEEFDDERTDAEYVWVLDPIDGTKSFISGMLAWGSLIALTRGGTPVYGMMHQPYVGERFTGDGNMARYRGPSGERNLHVRHCATLEDAVLFTTSPLLMNAEDRAKFVTVENVVKLSRYGGDCYAYCMLAAGQLDLVIESGLNAYDIMALIPIVRGAGGVITSWDGGPAEQGGRIIAAGDKRVHEAAMKILRA